MSKLIEMFAQARRAQSGSGIGFIGKNRQLGKPRAAAVVVTFATPDASLAEAAVKAGADGLLFDWDGEQASLEALQKAQQRVSEQVEGDLDKRINALEAKDENQIREST